MIAQSWGISMIADRLTSLAVLVMLAFALMIPVSAQDSVLAPELLSKMLDDIARHGVDRVVPASFADRLGLTVAGQGWPSRQIGANKINSDIEHAVYVNRGSDKDLLLTVTGRETIECYRIRRDGILVIAMAYDNQTRQFTMRDQQAGAQKDLEYELKFWSGFLAQPDRLKGYP
jgi:hypothetical protein